jgi:hypothetical protein
MIGPARPQTDDASKTALEGHAVVETFLARRVAEGVDSRLRMPLLLNYGHTEVDHLAPYSS